MRHDTSRDWLPSSENFPSKKRRRAKNKKDVEQRRHAKSYHEGVSRSRATSLRDVFARRLCSTSLFLHGGQFTPTLPAIDRKSTRLNSSHPSTSYAVFCLKKKKKKKKIKQIKKKKKKKKTTIKKIK